jgi:hypothetical protein
MSSPIKLRLTFLLATGCSPVATDSDGVFDLVADTTPSQVDNLACDACGGNCIFQALSYEKRYHVATDIAYAITPPAGGPHHPCWADFGVHPEPVADEQWVHNLEHGAVVASYTCESGCDAEISSLQAWAETAGPWTLVTPYAASEWPYTLSAWGYRLQTDCVDEDAFDAFYADHSDRGPESTLADAPQQCM